MSEFCINKSGLAFPVYENSDSLNPGSKVGTIYNNEAFSYEYGEGGNSIWFRDSSGNIKLGFMPLTTTSGDPIMSEEEANLFYSYCTDYAYGTVRISGTTYKTFKFRRSEEIYTASATRWGTVAKNMRVACLSSLAGETHPDWKAINYVERTDGEWIKVDGDGYSYGFVDTGLNVGSGASTISMYGTW